MKKLNVQMRDKNLLFERKNLEYLNEKINMKEG